MLGCDNSREVAAVQINSPANSNTVVLVTRANEELLRQVDSSDVVSTVVDVTIVGDQSGVTAELCFSVADDVDTDEACLGFIDEDEARFKCEDECLERNDQDQLCGETTHFTNFAILLAGGGSADGKCGSSTNDFITGEWWGDLTLTASLVGFCLLFGIAFILLALFVPPFGKLFFGQEHLQQKEFLSTLSRPTSIGDADGQL